MLVNDSVNVKNAKVEGFTDGHPELIDLIKINWNIRELFFMKIL